MSESVQKEKNWDTAAVDARVNGQRVARAPRARGGDKRHYNPDIAWLLNESRGELGESGWAPDPSAGGGGDPSNNWPAIEKLHRARFAVQRWRRLNSIMSLLDTETRTLLKHRYRVTEREHSEVIGLRAAFADLATLAWHLCSDRASMRHKLSSGKSKRDDAVTILRNVAIKTNRRIHIAWLDAEREAAFDFEVPKRMATDA